MPTDATMAKIGMMDAALRVARAVRDASSFSVNTRRHKTAKLPHPSAAARPATRATQDVDRHRLRNPLTNVEAGETGLRRAKPHFSGRGFLRQQGGGCATEIDLLSLNFVGITLGGVGRVTEG